MVPAGGVEGGGGVAAPAQRRGGAGGGQVAAAVGGGASATRESNSQLRVDPGRRCVCVCGGVGGRRRWTLENLRVTLGTVNPSGIPFFFLGPKAHGQSSPVRNHPNVWKPV